MPAIAPANDSHIISIPPSDQNENTSLLNTAKKTQSFCNDARMKKFGKYAGYTIFGATLGLSSGYALGSSLGVTTTFQFIGGFFGFLIAYCDIKQKEKK